MPPNRMWCFSEPVKDGGRKVIVHAMNLLVLRTHDLERSRAFYEALGLRFQHFEFNSGEHGIQGPVPPDAPLVLNVEKEGMPPPHTSMNIYAVSIDEPIAKMQIGFFVDSVDVAVQEAVSAGGTLLSEPAKWPYGRCAAVADPDGHRVELSDDPHGQLTGDYPASDQRGQVTIIGDDSTYLGRHMNVNDAFDRSKREIQSAIRLFSKNVLMFSEFVAGIVEAIASNGCSHRLLDLIECVPEEYRHACLEYLSTLNAETYVLHSADSPLSDEQLEQVQVDIRRELNAMKVLAKNIERGV